MARRLGRDRESAIKDMARDLSVMIGQTGGYLAKHASPETGGLNVKQTQAILYLAEVAKRTQVALAQIHKDIERMENMLGEEVISLSVGEASITMKKDGTISIRGKDISITGSGDVQIRAAKDLTLKGQKIHEN